MAVLSQISAEKLGVYIPIFLFLALFLLGISVSNEPSPVACQAHFIKAVASSFYGQMPLLTPTLSVHPGLRPALSWAGLPPLPSG